VPESENISNFSTFDKGDQVKEDEMG